MTIKKHRERADKRMNRERYNRMEEILAQVLEGMDNMEILPATRNDKKFGYLQMRIENLFGEE